MAPSPRAQPTGFSHTTLELVVATAFFYLYFFVMMLVVLNIVISILMEGYASVKTNVTSPVEVQLTHNMGDVFGAIRREQIEWNPTTQTPTLTHVPMRSPILTLTPGKS